MTDSAVDVVEVLLTARAYERADTLEPDDLPPGIRTAMWDDEDGIEPPLPVTESVAREGTGVAEPWAAVSGLMFTDQDSFSGEITLVDEGMAADWFLERVESDRLHENPVLAYKFRERADVDVDYDTARADNRPMRADRAWIDGLLGEYFDEEDQEMLDLVDVKAPEEVEMTLDDLVLTKEQETEVTKVMKAIEHRDYLANVGLREIGKLLFVGPPGTGKTSTARALARELDLPFVEVKLSMVTSQYLGETAKNVDKVFEVAKRLSPCILFIDEFDFVAKTRRSDEHAALKRAVNTLLKSIDEVSLVRDDVLLIGATNHPDQLDAAAWRRFDEILNFPKPDEGMRADIIEVVTRQVEVADLDAVALAKNTSGLTGSDLRLVLREAVLEALLEDRTTLKQADLEAAIEEFEERDNLKRMDTMSERLVADGDPGSEAEHDHDHDD